MDPIEQNVVPAPMSPETVPSVEANLNNENPEEELSQDQMRSNLADMMAKLEVGHQNLTSQSASSDLKVKQYRNEALRQVFDILEQAGVDPTDPEAVRAFLDNIKTENPELAMQIEEIIDSILGDEDAESQNMNIKSNDQELQEGI